MLIAKIDRFSQSGQATIEYLLLTALVVGIALTAFQKPLQTMVSHFESNQAQYTQVVQQQQVGIPASWFGGNYSSLGGATAGGNNAGGGNSSSPGNNSSAPGATTSTNGGDNAGGDNYGNTNSNGGNNSAPGGGPGGGGTTVNLTGALSGPGGGGTTNGGGRKSNGGSGTEDQNGDEDQNSGGGKGAKIRRNESNDGSVSPDEDAAHKAEDANKGKAKKDEAGDEINQQKALYGSTAQRVGHGGCQNLDLRALLKIAFIIALLFILISMLLQKKGNDK